MHSSDIPSSKPSAVPSLLPSGIPSASPSSTPKLTSAPLILSFSSNSTFSNLNISQVEALEALLFDFFSTHDDTIDLSITEVILLDQFSDGVMNFELLYSPENISMSDIVDISREAVSSSNDLLIDSISSNNILGGEISFFAPTSLSDIQSVAPSIVQLSQIVLQFDLTQSRELNQSEVIAMEDLFLSFTSENTKDFGMFMINVTLDAQSLIEHRKRFLSTRSNRRVKYSGFAHYLSSENAQSNFRSIFETVSPSTQPSYVPSISTQPSIIPSVIGSDVATVGFGVIASVGAAAAAGSAAAASAGAAAGAGGGAASSSSSSSAAPSAGKDALAEATKQMRGRNMKKATGAQIAKGKKQGLNIRKKREMMNQTEQRRKEHFTTWTNAVIFAIKMDGSLSK